MNPLEHQLSYPHGDALPAVGASIEIAPGLKWLRMALPFALDHINLWLLRDRVEDARGLVEGWAIVDCGIANEPTRAAWEQVFANELEGLPVTRVICTHMHPDHIGNAHWLVERFGCGFWISSLDWHAAQLGSLRTTGNGGAAAAAHFGAHGLIDEEALAKVRARTNYYASMVPAVPTVFHRLQDGLRLRIGAHEWQCIAGYGHAPEHIALYSETQGMLISGDMVLPRISTNVSVWDMEPESNPLQQYLDSLERYRPLPAATLVLPSHGRPFTGLHTRIDQLRAHHDERLADVLAACRERPTTASDLLEVLFRRKLDLHQITFAMGEAVAHLHKLWFEGALRRERGADGVLRFTAA
ncbi:MBL fold metallo-hydrolase [Rivibacter subsaxonicus]|uniref:Glyoxylase-like metal-dependent hydrolase (Beta-lactamase superfamily II) n=1 Tax=Rivibacter subsaxonicus TaxID=457575 RepID=A0A4Q7VZT5_9BURK|nr:MBL fold metallo-hydrolase [Rivibacter subsaxonicus]RZU02088.1 glyoxylase-like metal-dependent hydrolase (beta-lactamase superfamily II) [Rivibacter subsaxonicus]